MGRFVQTDYFDEQLTANAIAPPPPPLVVDTFTGADGTHLEAHTPNTVNAPATGTWVGFFGQRAGIMSNAAVPIEPSFTRDYVSYAIDGGQKDVRLTGRLVYKSADSAFSIPPPCDGTCSGPAIILRCGDDGAGTPTEAYSAYVTFDGTRVWAHQLVNTNCHAMADAAYPLSDDDVVTYTIDVIGEHLTVILGGVTLIDEDFPVPTRAGDHWYGFAWFRRAENAPHDIGPKALSQLDLFQIDPR